MTKDEIMSLVNRSLFAVLGYTDETGLPCVRRVFCTWHKGLRGHLISTNTSSSHVRHLLRRPDACLYFFDDSAFTGACFSGRVTVHQEPEWKELLWHPGDEKYYPLGVGDPDYCVIEFQADACAYYRFDGKGVLTKEEMHAYAPDAEYEDGYVRYSESGAQA